MVLMLRVSMTVVEIWAHVVREHGLVRLLVAPGDWTVMLGRIGTQAHGAGPPWICLFHETCILSGSYFVSSQAAAVLIGWLGEDLIAVMLVIVHLFLSLYEYFCR